MGLGSLCLPNGISRWTPAARFPPFDCNAAPVFRASAKLEWMFVRASTPKEVRACPLGNALHPFVEPWKSRRGFLEYCQTWGAIFASFRENKHSFWVEGNARVDENAHARPPGAATAGRTEVLLLHRPFRPSYFSKVLFFSRSSHSIYRACILLYRVATIPPLKPPRRGLEITVSCCVRYLDLEGPKATPLYKVRAFVAWIYQNPALLFFDVSNINKYEEKQTLTMFRKDIS